MQRKTMALLFAACVMSAFAGGLVGSFLRPGEKALAATGTLPPELFVEGGLVNSMEATYLVEEVRGEWVQLRLYRTLDRHKAQAGAARWVYVPAIDGAWSKAE